ncbi:MAG: DnaJ domain-containing protein [Chloroflexota bacterium]|nr:DnaJ domain-containing protein [Chloroflexota bacterium]
MKDTSTFEGIDLYSMLGVAPNASFEDIKAAYRRAARRLHPDVNRNNPGAGVQFQQITVAYETLGDTDKRKEYDKKSQQHADNLHFTLRITPSKRRITSLPEPQVIYLLAEVFPDARASQANQKRDSRLNLCLVLDRSNSMNGPRLNQVKVAAHQIIDQLGEQDIFSLVAFNDRAELVIPATTVTDKAALKARVSMMTASGGTEIFQGLEAGITEIRKFLAPRLINHIILLTDGNTFGDADKALDLAKTVSKDGITISGMGLGQEWNDRFLDELANSTGGSSSYINSAGAVVRFLNTHVRHLSNTFADRMHLSIAPDPDVKLESAFKLQPNAQPLIIDQGFVPMGSLQKGRSISTLLQYELPAKMPLGFRSLSRIVVIGDILGERIRKFQAISDISLEITSENVNEQPPSAILDALGKLTLYRMQERANDALEKGDVRQATRQLENLALRLAAMGESELAQQAKQEAQQVAHTAALTDKGKKALKYQTRSLLLYAENNEDNGNGDS